MTLVSSHEEETLRLVIHLIGSDYKFGTDFRKAMIDQKIS